MNWAAPYPANRKEIYPAAEMDGKFLKTGSRKKEVISKECTVLGKVPLLWERKGLIRELHPVLTQKVQYGW